MTNKTISIPESKLIVRRLRRDENKDTASAAELIPIDSLHGMSLDEAITELKRNQIKVNQEFLMLATGRIIKIR